MNTNQETRKSGNFSNQGFPRSAPRLHVPEFLPLTDSSLGSSRPGRLGMRVKPAAHSGLVQNSCFLILFLGGAALTGEQLQLISFKVFPMGAG